MDDSGQYQCLAENELGAVEKVVVLALQSESRARLSWALGGGTPGDRGPQGAAVLRLWLSDGTGGPF